MTSNPQHHPIEDLTRSRTQKLIKAITSYYAIALAMAVGCTVVFGWLAEEVLEKEFTSANTSILLAIHAHDSPTLDSLAFAFTDLGSAIGVIIIGSILATSLVLMKRYVDLGTFAGVLLGSTIISAVFKILFHQIRPLVFTPLTTETTFSFPSGHAMGSFSVWGFFAWWIISLGPKEIWRWLLALLGIVIATLVALSRLYLGVHWPTDVIAGMLLAFAWLGVCITGHRWLTRHARRERKRQQALAHAA